MRRKTFLLFLFFATLQLHLFAQSNEQFNPQFGKVSPSDFNLPADAVLGEANAIIVCDKGSVEFVTNNKSWFSMKYTRKTRVKILNANGVDAADFKIYLYRTGGATDRIVELKASSFNLQGNQVVQTTLSNDQVYPDKIAKNWELRKFSVPGAKAGSIVDVVYTVESEFIGALPVWEFNGAYPRYWSQYSTAIPTFFNYVGVGQVYQEYYQKIATDEYKDFFINLPVQYVAGETSTVGQSFKESANVHTTTWVMKNISPVPDEPFVASKENYVSKLEFQLNQFRFTGQPFVDRMAKWTQVVENYNESDRFGANLYKSNAWLDEELKIVLGGSKEKRVNAELIYKHLRDHYTCTGIGEVLTSNLKAVQKVKSGNVADINLTLVAMLNRSGIKSYPVLMSTRRNGRVNEFFPLLNQYNYVIAQATIDGEVIYLDATEPGLAFGVLPPQCYNGQARVMSQNAPPVYFYSDSISNRSRSVASIQMDDNGAWVGNFSEVFGAYGSLDLRQMVREGSLAKNSASIKKDLSAEIEITEPIYENLDSFDQDVIMKYDLKIANTEESKLLYLNPMFHKGIKNNPFQAATRMFPVEMPYLLTEVHVAMIQIPDGYALEEVPKSTRVNLFEGDGKFEYLVGVDGNRITIQSKLNIKKANFLAEDYEVLRDFFAKVIEKHAETIVISKLK